MVGMDGFGRGLVLICLFENEDGSDVLYVKAWDHDEMKKLRVH